LRSRTGVVVGSDDFLFLSLMPRQTDTGGSRTMVIGTGQERVERHGYRATTRSMAPIGGAAAAAHRRSTAAHRHRIAGRVDRLHGQPGRRPETLAIGSRRWLSASPAGAAPRSKRCSRSRGDRTGGCLSRQRRRVLARQFADVRMRNLLSWTRRPADDAGVGRPVIESNSALGDTDDCSVSGAEAIWRP